MAPSMLRRVPSNQHEVPRTADRKSMLEGSIVVSPSSPKAETPSTVGQLSPTRRMLFERRAVRDSSYSQQHQLQHQKQQQSVNESPESRQESEIEDLRVDNERKSSQLKVLHQRFQNIQEGLGSIDQERHNLVEKAKWLEKEKRHIQKQLELREREIDALVKRCASQEEKMRESSRLRALNKELSLALESAQNQLTETDQERQDLQLLRTQLQESELAREQLQDRLRKVQREHDSIADTLRECLANIRKLTEEKEQIESDRRRERKVAELEMEKQRLIHVQESNLWKESMENKQIKIEQMERILQENMHAKTSLRREHAIREEEVKSAIEKYETKIAELEDELNRISGEKDEDYESTFLLLQSKIEEKEALMAGLKDEFSGQMGELMKTQSSLDEAEEEKKMLETKVAQLEKLECEYSALQEYVEVLGSNLADLTSENAYLFLDKESLEEETQFLHHKMKELESELARSQQHRMEWIGGNNIQGQREELQKELGNARNEVTKLQSELAMRAQSIEKLEREMKESRQRLFQKEEEIRKLNLEKDDTSNALQSSLSEARNEVTQLNIELQFRETQLKMLENSLESERNERLHQELKLKEMERTMSHEIESRAQEAANQVEILKEQIQNMKLDLETERQCKDEVIKGKQDTEISLQKCRNELKLVQDEVEQLQSTNSQLASESEASRLSLSHTKDEAERGQAQSKLLQKELHDAFQRLQEKQDIIERLEAELDTVAKEKSSLLNMLQEARETIDSIETRLTDTTESTLEDQLKTTLADLAEQQSKTQKLEEQYHAALDMQSRREKHNREALSKIAILENQLMDLQEEQAELRNELNKATALTDSQDKEIKKFHNEKFEWEQEYKKLKDQCEKEHATCISSEQELTKTRSLNTLLKVELDDSTKTLLSYEQRIQSLDEALAKNEMVRSDLESKLAESVTRIESLEQEITSMRTKSTSSDDQLNTALTNLSKKEILLNEAEMKLEEKSVALSNLTSALESAMKSTTELEEKLAACQSQLSSQDDLVATYAKKATALEHDVKISNEERVQIVNEKETLERRFQTLEKEMLERLSASEYQYRQLASQHSEVCQKLDYKHKMVESLEEDIRVRAIEMDQVKLRLSDRGEEIALLEQEIIDRGVKIKGLEKEIEILDSNSLEHAFSESEAKRSELERQLEVFQASIDELTLNLQERDSRVDELDQRLIEVTKEKLLEEERADKTSDLCLALEDRIRVQDGLIASSEAKSTAALDQLAAANKAIIEKEKEAKNLHEVIASLESTIMVSQNSALAAQEVLNLQLNEERERSTDSCMKLACLQAELAEEKQRITRYEGMFSEQEDTITSLRYDLRQTIETMETDYRKKEAAFKVDLAKLETRVALKDDEIQELRVIELKDKEEAMASLSEAFDEFKGQAQAKEAQMMKTLNELKRENETLKNHLNDQEQALRSSQEQLMKTGAATQDELSRMKMALDMSIIRSKEELNKQREEIETRNRLVVTEMSSKLRTVERKLSETDTVLRERTSLLSEMVEHNKDLESRLDKQKAQISSMEEESRRCHKDLSDTRLELHRVREDLSKRENSLLAKLNEERTHRDNAERALSKLKVQVSDATAAKKAVADLERDNQVLKDKIIRQEAFLQRKLQKEKIQRGRVTPATNVPSSNSVGSACPTTPKSSRPSPGRLSSTGTSMIPTINHDNSHRSTRSISSALPRSGIPSISTSKSAEAKGNMFEPTAKASWDVDLGTKSM